MRGGWIKLHRKMLNWRWYTDANTFRLFTHLLLKANFEPSEWLDRQIGVGQCVVGFPTLAESTGLTVSQLRTAMKKLKLTGEITVEVTSRFSVITLCNYERYQGVNSDDDRQDSSRDDSLVAGESQSNRNIKEYKETKKEKKRYIKGDPEYDIAYCVYDKLVRPRGGRRPNLQLWAGHVEKALRIDKRDKEYIMLTIDAVVADPFWAKNILSTQKLRDKMNEGKISPTMNVEPEEELIHGIPKSVYSSPDGPDYRRFDK